MMFKSKEISLKRGRIFTKSNLLSLFRLFLSIPLWFLLDNLHLESTRYITAFVCLVAIGTDFLDGYLARRLNEVTEVGKIIDPLADKVAIGIVALKLYMIGEMPSYYFFTIIGRDILIFLGGIFLSYKIRKVIPSNTLGKITVTILGVVILLIILKINRDSILFLSFYIISILMIFTSLITYIIRAVELLKQKNYESI